MGCKQSKLSFFVTVHPIPLNHEDHEGKRRTREGFWGLMVGPNEAFDAIFNQPLFEID